MTNVHVTWLTAAEERALDCDLNVSFRRLRAATREFYRDDLSWQEEGAAEFELEQATSAHEAAWGLQELNPPVEGPANPPIVVRELDVWAAAHYQPCLLGYEIAWGLANPGESDSPFDKVNGKGVKQSIREALQAKRALKLLFLELEDLGIDRVYCSPARPELSRLYKRFGFDHVDGLDTQLVANVSDVLDKLCKS